MGIELIKIQDIIEALPTLIIYLVPGYIFIWVFKSLMSFKKEDENLILKSLVLSYIIVNIYEFVLSFSYKEIIRDINFVIIVLIISLIVGYFSSRLIKSEHYNRIRQRLKITLTANNSIWQEIADKHGVAFRVYLRDNLVIYQGDYRRYEIREESDNTYIMISNYKTFNYQNGALIEDKSIENKCFVVINTKDIERIEGKFSFYQSASHPILIDLKICKYSFCL